MRLISFTDQLLYRLLTKNIDKKIDEIVLATRDVIPKEEVDIDRFDAMIPEISKFVSIFKNNFKQDQIDAMIYRLNHLEIVEELGNPLKLSGFVSLGCYNDKSNRIVINHYPTDKIPVETWETLMHELLHMASTRKTSIGHITGLEIPDFIGLNLNEGYTEYLAEKYFTKGMKYVESKDEKVFFAKGIENIIGKDKMEEFYFDANFGSLVKELEKYASRKDILKLLYLIDRIEDPLFKRKNIKLMIQEIAKINEVKLKRDLEEGIITQKQYDIEHAIKVDEYKEYRMWSEETKVKETEDGFILIDQGNTSTSYLFTKTKEKTPKTIQKTA